MLDLLFTPTPISINWNLTNLCNFNCKHCYSNDIRNSFSEMNTDEVYKTLEVLKKENVDMITFGGGESLLRKDIWDILKRCNELNLNYRIISNGFAIDNEICYKLRQLNISELLISLDGSKSLTHDLFRNMKGSFKAVISAIKSAQNVGIKVMILTNINKINYKEIYDMCKLIDKLNVFAWRINELKDLGNYKKNIRELTLNKQEIKKCHNIILNYEFSSNCEILFDSIFCYFSENFKEHSILNGCHCGSLSLGIRSNGDIVPCVYYDHVIGNILKDDIDLIWKNDTTLNSIRQRTNKNLQSKCKNYKKCRGGCFARSYLKFGDINCCDPLCWINE